MKPLTALAAVAALALTAPQATSSDRPEAAAQAAAYAWLALIDSGQYAKSWQAAAAFFRARVSQAQWESSVASAREPFGALKSRKVDSATLTTSLPGAPDGEYVVIQFSSSFEHKASAIETVTPMKEADGSWKVSGYYLR